MPIEREKHIPCLRHRERGSAVGNKPRRAVVGLHFEIRRVHRIRPSGRRIISLRPHYQRRGAQSHAKRQPRLDRFHNPPPLITLLALTGARSFAARPPIGRTRRSGAARRIVEAVNFVTTDLAFFGEMTIIAAFEELSDGTEVTLVFEKLPPACGRRATRPARASVWSSWPAASNDGTEDSLGGALCDDPTTLSLRSPAADRASGANLTLG